MAEYMDYNEWLEKELNNLERVRDIKHKALISSDKRIKDLEAEKEQLKKENKKQNEIIIDYREQNMELRNDIGRLQNELFSEHLKQVETEDFIDKIKKELKEYRGF